VIFQSLTFSRLLLAALLATGFAVVWGLVSWWTVLVAQPLLAPTVVENLVFLADGSPVVVASD
jgi:hypothetical protein